MNISRKIFIFAAVFLSTASLALADTRFFIPDVRMEADRDTQLIINNKGDRDQSIDILVIEKSGQLLGQAQAQIAAHSAKSFTLTESFGKRANFKGWLAALSKGDELEMSYTLTGPNPVTQDAQRDPSREMSLTVPVSGDNVLRISDTSGYRNGVVIKRKDQNGRVLGIRQVGVQPYGQAEVSLSDIEMKEAASLELWGESDFLAVVGERIAETASTAPAAPEQVLSLVIDSNVPVGAYQVALRFDPAALKLTEGDIQGGSAAGFTGKPLAVNIDNTKGELQIATFQIGSAPAGMVEVARIHARPEAGAALLFGIHAEDITDVTGKSILSRMPTVRLLAQ